MLPEGNMLDTSTGETVADCDTLRALAAEMDQMLARIADARMSADTGLIHASTLAGLTADIARHNGGRFWPDLHGVIAALRNRVGMLFLGRTGRRT